MFGILAQVKKSCSNFVTVPDLIQPVIKVLLNRIGNLKFSWIFVFRSKVFLLEYLNILPLRMSHQLPEGAQEFTFFSDFYYLN